MAIDISKNATHNRSFPSKIASAMGQYGHIFNGVLQSQSDNGIIGLKGDYVDYDQYEIDDLAATLNGFAGVIRGQHADGTWEIEVTELPATGTVCYLYNSPASSYSEYELQDEKLFYNEKGDVVQAMQLMVNDVFTMSVEGFNGTPKAGKSVTFANGKYVVGA